MALEHAAISSFDLSFFDNGQMLELIPPERLFRLGITLRARCLPDIEDHIAGIADDAALDEDPEGHFEMAASAMDRLEQMEIDPDGAELIDAGRKKIEEATKKLAERQDERDSETEDDSDWTHIVTTTEKAPSSTIIASDPRARSIFDDVDR